MRYVVLKTVVRKIVDQSIDSETAFAILSLLKDKRINCFMRIDDGCKIGPVRIIDLDDEKCTIILLGKRSSLKKSFTIDQLDYLEVDTQDDVMFETKSDISRWLLLSPSSDFAEDIAE